MNDHFFHYDEFNPYCLFKALARNIWVVLLLCISTVLCYSAYSKLTYEARYTSSATFMVSAKDSSSAYNSLTTTQSMANVFAEVFQSNVLRDKVKENMEQDASSWTIKTSTVPETNLLIVSVTSPTPDLSFRVLQLVIEHYSSISDYIFSNAQLEVIRDPIIPVVPVNPLNLKKNYPLLLVFSGFLSIALIVFLHLMRDTVQTTKAARRKLDARLLRSVRHEARNKTTRSRVTKKHIAPLINGPLISKNFIEDNLSLCSTVEYHARKRKQQVILVTSAGENEGKSTVAANLALSLAQKGKKVVILDCDFRKPSMHLIFENPISKEQSLPTFLLSEQLDSNDFLIPLSKHGITVGFSHSNIKHISRLVNNKNLQVLLKQLRQQVDYIIMDTPPMLVASDAEALALLSDAAVMVVRTDFLQTTAINDCLDKLRKATPDLCGVVLNNHRTHIF